MHLCSWLFGYTALPQQRITTAGETSNMCSESIGKERDVMHINSVHPINHHHRGNCMSTPFSCWQFIPENRPEDERCGVVSTCSAAFYKLDFSGEF
jgi:hypothetical protein